MKLPAWMGNFLRCKVMYDRRVKYYGYPVTNVAVPESNSGLSSFFLKYLVGKIRHPKSVALLFKMNTDRDNLAMEAVQPRAILSGYRLI